MGSLGEGVGSGGGTILGSEAFVEWQAAQKGGLNKGEDYLFDPASDGLFLNLGRFNVLFITVRTAAAVLVDDTTGSTYDFPIGNYWLIGSYWCDAAFDGMGSAENCKIFATAFHTDLSATAQGVSGLNRQLQAYYGMNEAKMGNRLNVIDTSVGILVPTSGVARTVVGERIATSVPVGEQLESTDSLYNFSNSFSISAWYYQVLDNDLNYIASHTSISTNKYYLHTQSDSWNPKFAVQDSAFNVVVAEAGFTYNNGEWVFLVGVYDKAAGLVGISVNGATLVTQAISNPIIDLPDGTFKVGQIGVSTVDFYIDDVTVHGRALTQTEISMLYNGGNGRQFPYA